MHRSTRIGGASLLAAAAAAALTGTCAQVEVEPEPVEHPEHALSLEEAVELALHNNPDVRIGRQRVLLAASLVDESASMFWPDVTVSERFTRTDRPSRVFADLLDQGEFSPGIDFNDPGTISNFRLSATAGVTLYDGGRRKARLARSEARLGSAVAAEEEVASVVALEVARAWYRIHEARTGAGLSERSVRVLERLLELSRAELEAGAALPEDVRELQVRLAEAEAQTYTARDAARRAETGLGLLLGFGVQERVELLEDAPATQGPVPLLEELLDRARLTRPELVRAQRELEIAVASLREVEAGYWPELGVYADAGFNDSQGRLERFNWLFGVDLVYSLTEALRTPHRARGAAAALITAHERGRRTLLEVESEVESAWLDAGAAERDLEVAREDELRARESLRRAEAERDAGAGRAATRLRTELEAQQASARTRVAELRRDLSRIALAHATGDFPERTEEETDEG